jgi:hypothetical protein
MRLLGTTLHYQPITNLCAHHIHHPRAQALHHQPSASARGSAEAKVT